MQFRASRCRPSTFLTKHGPSIEMHPNTETQHSVCCSSLHSNMKPSAAMLNKLNMICLSQQQIRKLKILPEMLLIQKNDIRPRIQIGVGMGISKINARVFVVHSLSAMKNEMMHLYHLFSPFIERHCANFPLTRSVRSVLFKCVPPSYYSVNWCKN